MSIKSGEKIPENICETENDKNMAARWKKILLPVIIAAICVVVVIAVVSGRKTEDSDMTVSEPDTENVAENADVARDEEYSLSFLTDSIVFENQGDVKGISLNTNIEDVSEIEWISGDDSIATVDEDGYVMAVSAGETYVVASWNGLNASCRIICDFEESVPYDSTEEELQLDVNTSADYSANLNPDEYLYYNSPEFSFGYPSQLYCDGFSSTIFDSNFTNTLLKSL